MTSAMWRIPFQRRRCLVPASGFYVSASFGSDLNRRFAFERENGKCFAFAGIWDEWQEQGSGRCLRSFSIITTVANELVTPYHYRMPLILPEYAYDRWLKCDPGTSTDLLYELLCSCPSRELVVLDAGAPLPLAEPRPGSLRPV